jgi:predicted dinucleotide-binding enzyme
MSSSKTVFITGATAGIGRTTALHLATLGHHVIASGRKRAELDKLAAEARGLASVLDVVALDVTQPASIAAAVDAVARLTGDRGLDVLTNFEATAVTGLDGFAATPYGRALANYERMSKAADRFASNPIVVAHAIARAVAARRPAARYVAPRRTTVALWLGALLPTAVWDWAMRRAGYLTPDALDLQGGPSTGATAAPVPQSAPAAEVRAAAR